jgi:hypothetical protein
MQRAAQRGDLFFAEDGFLRKRCNDSFGRGEFGSQIGTTQLNFSHVRNREWLPNRQQPLGSRPALDAGEKSGWEVVRHRGSCTTERDN